MTKRQTAHPSSSARKRAITAAGAGLVLALVLVLVVAPKEPDTTRTGMDEAGQEAEARMEEESIEAILESTALRDGYEPATQEKMNDAAHAFQRLLQEGGSPELVRNLEDLGFSVPESRKAGGSSLLFVREAPERATGKGFYMIKEQGSPVLVQAPHRYKDAGTGTILARLMEEHDFGAAAWNTAPRWYEGASGRVDADLAHIEVSHFNAFTLAFARAYPEGTVVQLHGFARDKRTTAYGRSASIIVSSGTERPAGVARAVAECLGSALPAETVLLYPMQVRELGATTNTNAQALRDIGFDRFVHIELSRELRDRLLDDRGLRARLAESIMPC